VNNSRVSTKLRHVIAL